MKKTPILLIYLSFLIFASYSVVGQSDYDTQIDENFKNTLRLHKALVSIPNLPKDPDLMLENLNWLQKQYDELGFSSTLLETSTLPILITEKEYNPDYKTVLFYFHIDGQPISPEAWNQDHPFEPVLKEKDDDDNWQTIDWQSLDEEINDEWRIFGRSAADDKAPIIMLLNAFQILKSNNSTPQFNVKLIFDPEEEYGSQALLSTLDTYKDRYDSDYFIVMDGPAHNSNKPTVTFGCRGIATCSITTYGSQLPQHSGHYGNYVPNPVFDLANILSSMKDAQGKVLIEDYYKGINIDEETFRFLESVPYDSVSLNSNLGIYTSEKVGRNYQEALQYPSLNVRQIETSWKGRGLKTIIPELATAYIDIRLVPETDGEQQLLRIKKHLEQEGYYVIDTEPTDKERRHHRKIVKFRSHPGINAFRTRLDSEFGKTIRNGLALDFGYEPVIIRSMGGTVPIIPLISQLNVPTLIIPMVNMDNNQHSPNENIRIGNIRQGIKICLSILNMQF
jgi:acetylornithine deacetylase/succinyl-diaminopimelate desuccinylase-like protein